MASLTRWLAAIVEWLRNSQGIRFKIILYLSVARCYQSVRKSWLASYESFHTDENSKKKTARANCGDEIDDNEKILKYSRDRLVVPRINPVIQFYQILSTCTMVYAVVRILLPFHRWWDRYIGYGLKGHCLFMGHFIVIFQHNDYGAFLFSCFHLLWRLAQNEGYRRMDLSLVQFLYQDSELVAAEQRRLDDRKRGWWAPRNKPPTLPAKLYLRNLMCYRIKWNNHLVVYRMRSNRTREAKQKLERQFDKIFLASLSFFLVLASMFVPSIIMFLLTDGAYVARYPHCSTQLEQMLANGNASWWSFTPTPHRIISFFLDIWLNVFVWVDSGIALTLVVGLSYILNFDLIHHWSQIHQRLVKLEHRLRCQRPIEDKVNALEGSLWLSEMNHRNDDDQLTELKSNLERVEWAQEEANKEIYEVQAEMNDFFKQLRKADAFVSDVISATVVIWLSSFLTVCFMYGTLESKTEIRLIQVIGLVVLAAENFVLLELSIKVKQSYGLICTIMALDQSMHKEKFKIIIDLYGRQTRGPYYSLAHIWSYRSSTFLSLVGWTFSLAALSETFMKRLERFQP